MHLVIMYANFKKKSIPITDIVFQVPQYYILI